MLTANVPGFVENENKIEFVHIHNDVRYDYIIIYSYTFLDEAPGTCFDGLVLYFSKPYPPPSQHTHTFSND